MFETGLYSIELISNWFLSKASMTHKKLQKLCYYAESWYCAIGSMNGEKLMKEDFQAWVHGPVCVPLYEKYSEYRWEAIEKIDIDFGEEIDSRTLRFLNLVYATYSEYDEDDLEYFSRNEKPWLDARGDIQPYEACYNIITCDSMKEFYSKVSEENIFQ